MAERVATIVKTPETKQKCSSSCKKKPSYNSSGSSADRILQLQRTAGNQAVQRLLKSRTLQAKLRISQPNDVYEQEADRVAEHVMRSSILDMTGSNGEQTGYYSEQEAKRIKKKTTDVGESSIEIKRKKMSFLPFSEGNAILQRWNSDDHNSITTITGNKILSDPMLVWQVAERSAIMDITGKRLFVTGPRFLVGIDKGEGPEHGEDGNYSNIDEDSARSQNLRLQNMYRDLAVRYHKEFEDLVKQGQSVHKIGKIAAKSALALGNACHIAQDRGSHGEGVKGKGHNDPRTEKGWNPDDKSDNAEGYNKAIENTTKLFEEWVQLTSKSAEDSLLQRQAESENTSEIVPSVIHEVLHSSGKPLSESTRGFFEPSLGHDFSGVRIHTDTKAAEATKAVNARAFTVGRDVVFGEGEFRPGSEEGDRLLAHELVHVVQQVGGKLSIQRQQAEEKEEEIDQQKVARANASGPESNCTFHRP